MNKELNILGQNMRVFCKIFVTLLLLALVPQSVFSLDGSGQSGNPYRIKSIDDLKDLRNKIDGKTYIYVKQEADIDVSTATTSNAIVLPLTSTYSSIAGFRFPNFFYGEYDGNGYSLMGWKLPQGKRCGTNSPFYMSIFGKLGDASKPLKSIVKNLTIDGADIYLPDNTKDGWSVSFIAAMSDNASIENCNVINSTVQGNGGVMFGAISADNKGNIENCSITNTTFKSFKNAKTVGSISGNNSGKIKNCKAYNVTLYASSYIGGIVGSSSNNGYVETCSFNGKIGPSTNGEGKIENVGGLCGCINKGTFINCFSVFSSAGVWKSGGQIGGLIGFIDPNCTSAIVKNCYSFPQITSSQLADADIVLGRDVKREESSRLFESCYCYEYPFGENFKSTLTTGNAPFSDAYKEAHQIGISSSDFMKSGCFAEVLRDYHNNAKLEGKNPWREDVELQNDTLPVLKFMVDNAYDVDPFCHPLVFTLSHSESGNVSTLNGKIKFITKDQNNSSWESGIQVKEGTGEWKFLSNVTNKIDGNSVLFNKDYSYSKSKTTVYRAYTRKKTTGEFAYGKIDTICVGSSAGPIIIEGCDSVKSDDGRMFYYPKDNGLSFVNKDGDEVIVKLGHNEVQNFEKDGECGENSVTYKGTLYDKSGYYEIESFENSSGCTTTSYVNIKLHPTYTKDSIKVFGLGEKSYTYTPVGGSLPITISAGNDCVTTPKLLITDRVQYAHKGCDSLVLNVKYVIPIKYTYGEDEKWSCEPRVYKGVKYDKDTIIVDTVKTADSSIPGGYLYEINSYHVKVKIAKVIENTITSCGEIDLSACCNCTPDFDDPDKCFTKKPFDFTDVVKSKICGCDSIVYLTHYTVGERPTRDTSVVSCGPYTYEYKGKKTVWKKSGDYKVTRSGKNVGSCDNDTIVTYHVTIGESTSYNDSTIHGCGRVVYRTFAGEVKIFDKSQDFVDEVKTPEGCMSTRTIHIFIHKTSDKSPFLPVTGCAPFKFVKLNGDTLVLNEGTHVISDTLRSLDGCQCDSIVKTTRFNIGKPTLREEIVKTGCNEVVIEGVKYTGDTSFVVEKNVPSLFNVCPIQIQPYVVKIDSSVVEYFHVDTCGTYVVNGEKFTVSGKKEFTIKTGTECDNKQIYDIRIIKPTKIDSVVYACDSFVYKYFDGHKETVYDDGVVLVDVLQSKVCLCDSIVRRVSVNISHDSREVLPIVRSCGPYTYIKKSNGKKLLVETSQIVYDTLVTKYGCNVYYETEVLITPVVTIFDTMDVCKEYHSKVPVWNYNNRTVDIKVETSTSQTADLIFLTPNIIESTCMDTTKLFLTVHGVGKKTYEVVECDSYIFNAFDGSESNITADSVIVDTLKSTVCNCDSLIQTTKIKINYSVPETLRDTNTLRSCDSVIYKNSKGENMIFRNNIQFLDTFQMKKTGCDSVVVVDIMVPKSTGVVEILSACGDTTLIDSMNNNFPHFFGKSDVWHQKLGLNSEGCESFKEWQVNITPTPRDTIITSGCGEISFNGDTYTSEKDSAAEFKLVLSGDTKCDTIHNYLLTVYPKYNIPLDIVACDSFERNGIVYKKSIYFRDSLLTRNNCDSIVNVNIVINHAYDKTDTEFKCNEFKFIDEDFNGGKPIYVYNDTTIYVDKTSDNGCPYQFIKQIKIGHPEYIENEVFERFDVKYGYALYDDLILYSDTILYDTVSSENRCGSVLATKINLLMPEFKVTNEYKCFDEKLGYVTYRDLQLTRDTVLYDTISSENTSDIIVENRINLIIPSDDSVSIFTDTIFGCDSVKFVDEDFNGNLPISFESDTIIYLDKVAGDGCPYQLINLIQVGHHSDSLNLVTECYDSKLGYAIYRDLHLVSDTIIYDTIPSENRCGTVIKNKVHLSMPDFESNSEYLCFDPLAGYVEYLNFKLVSDTVVYDTVTSDNLCGKIVETKIHLISPNLDSTYVDTIFGCETAKLIDVDYNGGLPVYFKNDTVIKVDKHTDNGCDYTVDLEIQIGHSSDSLSVFELNYDSKLGYASYRDLQLKSDTILYDTIVSNNICGTVVTNEISIVMPIHDTISIDSCMYIIHDGVAYHESDTLTYYAKTESGRDSITHVFLNVNKCFPYPVLVNKYNWILVCNDKIFDDDKFKLKSDVKYNWYKNDKLVSTTSDSYFTEDKTLNGCYQVGIVIEDGSEYLSDLVCIDEKHGYTISPQPNPVDKMKPVTIVCDFPEEGVEGTVVEVFNMNADKVYVSSAISDEIVIPGMNVSGYYLVRLTTVSGKVLVAKYVVK